MFRRDRRPEPDQIEVTLGSRASLRGELRCDGSVRIDGVVEEGSRIETLGNVIIGSEARVAADIKAETVSVAGAYKGNLEARRVELLAGGRVWGAIRVASFLLDEGGYMHGELVMLTEEAAPEDPWATPAT
ncbi:MAG: polymer-forming cytoskeletal protein [Caldilineales bacterium]|nr:polymer-forming cytoskeletal protein [Caldilineales bacterium]